MKVLRTPDERFEGIDGYDFAPHYTEVEDADGTRLRLHLANHRRHAALAVMPQRPEPGRLATSPAKCVRSTRTAPSTPETST